jgi:bacterioferritin
MTTQEMIDLLNADLSNELKHMLFYLHHASLIRGLHREELREFLMEEAASEMKHVQIFQDLIIGLGGVPDMKPNSFDTFSDPEMILRYAMQMEDEVVSNYAQRMDQAATLESLADAKWVEIFLEDQILHSRADADNLRQMIAAYGPSGKVTF